MANLNSWRQEATLTLFSRWGSERRKIWPPSCCYPSWCSLSSWGSACTGKSRAAAPLASRSRQRWVAPRSVWRRRMSSAPLGCMSPTMPSELGRVEAQWWRGRRLRPSWYTGELEGKYLADGGLEANGEGRRTLFIGNNGMWRRGTKVAALGKNT